MCFFYLGEKNCLNSFFDRQKNLQKGLTHQNEKNVEHLSVYINWGFNQKLGESVRS